MNLKPRRYANCGYRQVDPTPSEIREHTAAFQAGWTRAEERRRRTCNRRAKLKIVPAYFYTGD